MVTAGLDEQPNVHWLMPDGYSSTNMPMLSVIITAYLPPTEWLSTAGLDKIVGYPDWVRSGCYDVVAKVAESQLADWRSQGDDKQLLQTMLQRMLAERFGLIIQKTTVQVPVYVLIPTKQGTRLKIADPSTKVPVRSMRLLGGGVRVPTAKGGSTKAAFYHATMKSLATILTDGSNRPVVDMTGLTGTYDFEIKSDIDIDVGTSDPPAVSTWRLDSIGLQLKPMTMPLNGFRVVRIERPLPN